MTNKIVFKKKKKIITFEGIIRGQNLGPRQISIGVQRGGKFCTPYYDPPLPRPGALVVPIDGIFHGLQHIKRRAEIHLRI